MKNLPDRADRASVVSMGLLCALNLIFLALFLITLFVVIAPARAEVSACRGTDMIAQMEKTDPEALARIRNEARDTLNGQGLLWKIEKNGAVSYLFGTMHVSDPRVTDVSSATQAAFDGAAILVVESTDALDASKLNSVLLQHPELTMFTDGTTLRSLLPASEVAVVERALDARGIPLASVSKMKPWMLSAMLALSACELDRQAGGSPVLDKKLATDAQAQGKTIEGLETALSQLQAMASLPMELHVKGLIDSLKLGDRMDDVTETMVVLYTKGATGTFWPFMKATVPDADVEGFKLFEETMVNARNRVMVDNAIPILDRSNAFLAIGALHLPGPDGLIELLRKRGYFVTPAG
ncbi:polysaccharide biosynthesis protein GumN [Mesorhizobium sp. NBSH29]|uniref:TraB/GumN family protein n=1 Tax=Mesorhizobium sp. NBSH29 TaxID=2654249 RepID=UPI0018963FEA|nr:TraB/GumN family protein [Mesorhizobium sp. NBSH29]QPC86034.1 polysaccharide biosynthesis protein GumN [Mesorhizobium sp. NBSH29]